MRLTEQFTYFRVLNYGLISLEHRKAVHIMFMRGDYSVQF